MGGSLITSSREAPSDILAVHGGSSVVQCKRLAPGSRSAMGGVRVLPQNRAITNAMAGIRVNSIHPGIVATPMGRAANLEDVAHVAVYRASRESAVVTGAEMDVDGGLVAV